MSDKPVKPGKPGKPEKPIKPDPKQDDSLRTKLKNAKHDEIGSMRASEAHKVLQPLIAQAGKSGLSVASGERSAVIYGVKADKNALYVYLDAEKSDANTLVIVNPPTLIHDKLGKYRVGGKSYREDVLQAIIDVICEHGGNMTAPKREFNRQPSVKPQVIKPVITNG